MIELAGPWGRAVDLSNPVVMGILNTTPDSFHDGGRDETIDSAVRRGRAMIGDGAAIIDIGGESTRPGAAPVDSDTQKARVMPVLSRLRAESRVFVSVDTSDPDVMRAAIAAGADMINDVRGLRRPGAIEACVETGAAVCIGHMQGEPDTMQKTPDYDDVVADVRAYLVDRRQACLQRDLAADRITLDPGIGFGKSLDHNLALLSGLARLTDIGSPLVLGVSRKSLFSKLLNDDSDGARLQASLVSAFWGAQQGVAIVRAHDVRETGNILRLGRRLSASYRKA